MRFYKMNMNFVRMLAVMVATGACVFNACATLPPPDVSYTVGGTSDLEQFNIKFGATTYNNVYAGGIQISQAKGSSDALPNNYVSICTDFLGSLYVGKTYSYDGKAVPVASGTIGGVAPGWSSTESFALASYLFNSDGYLGSGGLGTGKAGMTVEDMAALQLAVWIVLYDSTTTTSTKGKITTTVNDGSGAAFQVTGGNDSGAIAMALSEVTTAVAFINGLTGNYNNMDSLLVPDPTVKYSWQSNSPQELMYSSVPEPATILAGLLLLLPLGVSTIRNFRRSKLAL